MPCWYYLEQEERGYSTNGWCGGGGAHLGAAEVLDDGDLVSYSDEGTG
jgi:hypothetical protein